MCIGSKLAALEDDEHDRPDDGNEVERQVHEVADNGIGGELCEWCLEHLAELCDGIGAGRNLTLGRHEGGLVAGDEGLESMLVLVMFTMRGFLTPSKVSRSASSMRKFLLRTETMVELSLKTSRMVVAMARGPLKTVRMAA